MGLDQYAQISKGEEQIEIAYWRKHPNLQGWMENLWHSKGGVGEFNCVEVELTIEDLDDLQNAIQGGSLPETHGFFFGSMKDEEYKEQDLQFVKNAARAIDDGYKVSYSSWW